MTSALKLSVVKISMILLAANTVRVIAAVMKGSQVSSVKLMSVGVYPVERTRNVSMTILTPAVCVSQATLVQTAWRILTSVQE